MTDATLGLAVAQFAPTANTDDNLREMELLVATAAGRGARVVLLPEYSSYFVDPFDATLAEHAQTTAGDFVEGMRRIAAAHDVRVVAGLVESGDDDPRVRNTVVAVDGGGILARYRKVHLYDAFGQRESDWVQPGAIADPETFEVDGLRFGIMTCYDLRFPESTRTLADAGVDCVLVPAEWVRGPLKEHHWRTLLTARAIENTGYIAAADHPPPLGVGLSTIIDPQGVQLAAVGTGTDVAVANISTEVVQRVRRVNPALALRRYRVVPGD